MSHEATNWAIKQRGIKPSAKVVLWHLCDRYHPDQGCFPSLDTLADDCEMSRRSVQDQIEILVAAGLVTVEKMPREGGRLPKNRYRFAFENATENLGQILPWEESALGKNDPPPLAKSSKNLGQILPTNPVRGTSKGTSKGETPAAVLSELASPDAISSFLAYRRQSKGKALTLTAAKRLANNLRAIVQRGGRADDALGMAEERGWLTVEPDWYFRNKSSLTPAARATDDRKAKWQKLAGTA